MGNVVSSIGDLGSSIIGGVTGQTAAAASQDAAATQAAAQQAGLDYYKETEAVPQELRQASLQQLGGVYGLPGFEQYGGQQQLLDQAQSSPLYQSQLGAGTENVMRNANVTGGLRGGGGAADIAGFESNLLNQAYQQQLGGLQGLAQMPSSAGQVSQQMGAIGQTQAQGQIGAAQANQQGFNNMMNLGGAFLSDRRLKSGITKIGKTSHPSIDKYEWEWLPESGKTGKETGYIAQKVEQVFPELVITGEDGWKRIYRDKLEETLKEIH